MTPVGGTGAVIVDWVVMSGPAASVGG